MEIKNKKIGIFSDIHIGIGNESSIHNENVLKFSKWASNEFINNGITDIFILGDIFHNRNEISVETLSIADEFFKNFKDFRLFISTGNHDCFLKNKSDINSISILGGWSNITIYDKEIGLLKYKDKTISMVPWGFDPVDIPKTDYMFGHFEINTFNMNTYKQCEHGLSSGSLLDKSPFILSGHFHSKQQRDYKKGKIIYLGSPYQQNFGDMSEDRGVYILNLETSELSFIKNDISPKYFKLKITDYKKNPLLFKSLIENNIISFILDEKISTEDIILYKEKIFKDNPKHIRVDYENIDDTILVSNNNTDYNSSNILSSIEDFVTSMDIDHKKETIDYLKDLYNKLI
jgi:DNA repair exonuclease SbcCD nuclease subunit